MRFPALLLLSVLLLVSAPAPFTVNDMLDVVNSNVADVSDDGRWAAITSLRLRDRIGIDNRRFGDPTYVAPSAMELWVIDTRTGDKKRVFADRKEVRGASWSPDGSRLALLARNGDRFEPVIWDRATGVAAALKLPAGKAVDDAADLQWSGDGARLVLALRAADWHTKAAARFQQEARGPVIVHSSKDPFLNWIALRRLSLERSVWSLAPAGGEWKELAPEGRRASYRITEDGSALIVNEDLVQKTDYDSLGAGEARVEVAGATPRTVLKSTKGINLVWARDGRHFAYSKEGAVFAGSIDGGDPKQILGPSKKPEDKPADNDEAAKAEAAKQRFSVVRLSPRGERLVASNKEGLWMVEVATGAKDLMVKGGEEDKTAPRYQPLEWSPDGNVLYLSYASRQKWERGVDAYRVSGKKLESLFRDSRILSQWRMSKDGSRWVFAAAEGNRPADLYAADANFAKVDRLSEWNPQLKDKALGKTELISYLDIDGKKQSGVVYYPPDFQTGRKYPTVFIVYEQFFDDPFNGTTSVLNANGYVVVQPSVEFETGYPGEAWMKAVTAAANKVIDMGVADPERLGVQGTSYGGYATNLLITQTNRFAAAINISGKVNMVSFYTDSPRLGVRNIHAPEKSQDRLGATLWQQPQKYIAHSAIMNADRIKTPLLLITGEEDHNVPARQAMEMYYALRRLNKTVSWVNYVNGGHGMPTSTVEEVVDYHNRIVSWYDEHLKKPKAGVREAVSGQ
jgi:dipeptidyl aminopeptidase/acylaminoacyl peptidase